jgi:flagellar basal body-associated protein FliL
MKRSRKFIIILVSVLSSCILVAFGIIFLFKKQVAPPVYEMEKAREIIFQAWSSGADQNTFELLKQSENYYDSAMLCWQYENKKIFFTRDYQEICPAFC